MKNYSLSSFLTPKPSTLPHHNTHKILTMHLSHSLICSTFLSLASATATLPSLSSALSTQPHLSIFHALLKQFDILPTAQSAQNTTIIAPNDDAYRALAKWGFNVSEVPAEVAQALLKYHVLHGVHDSRSILGASDGWQIAHTHLTPPVLTNVSAGAAVKLYAAGTGSERTLMTESGLQVLGGVVGDEIAYDHGVIHTLNASMVLPHNISISSELAGVTSFLEAMEANEMVSMLEELRDVTLFVPVNAAMDKLEPALQLLSQQQMSGVLANHAVPGKVLYHDKLGAQTVQSLQGSKLEITTDGAGRKTVNGAKLVREDIIIYGGVMHLVDAVLTPDSGEWYPCIHQSAPRPLTFHADSMASKPVNATAADPSWLSAMLATIRDRTSSVGSMYLVGAVAASVLVFLGYGQYKRCVARARPSRSSQTVALGDDKSEKMAGYTDV